jgi:uncharacterized protein VirK/YbjX
MHASATRRKRVLSTSVNVLKIIFTVVFQGPSPDSRCADSRALFLSCSGLRPLLADIKPAIGSAAETI